MADVYHMIDTLIHVGTYSLSGNNIPPFKVPGQA